MAIGLDAAKLGEIFRRAVAADDAKLAALSPAARDAELARRARRYARQQAAYEKEKAFLDWCVANGKHPGEVRPRQR